MSDIQGKPEQNPAPQAPGSAQPPPVLKLKLNLNMGKAKPVQEQPETPPAPSITPETPAPPAQASAPAGGLKLSLKQETSTQPAVPPPPPKPGPRLEPLSLDSILKKKGDAKPAPQPAMNFPQPAAAPGEIKKTEPNPSFQKNEQKTAPPPIIKQVMPSVPGPRPQPLKANEETVLVLDSSPPARSPLEILNESVAKKEIKEQPARQTKVSQTENKEDSPPVPISGGKQKILMMSGIAVILVILYFLYGFIKTILFE